MRRLRGGRRQRRLVVVILPTRMSRHLVGIAVGLGVSSALAVGALTFASRARRGRGRPLLYSQSERRSPGLLVAATSPELRLSRHHRFVTP